MLRFPVEVVIKIKSFNHLKDILQQADEIIKSNPNIAMRMTIEIDLDDNSHQ